MDDFILDFGVSSLLGHRTKVKDVPKLTSLITSMLRNIFIKELVYPSRKNWRIPKGNEWLS
jgi:maintenance of morphology protein 1